MSTIRAQGIPQGVTTEDISRIFSVVKDRTSLASAKTTNSPTQTATITFENDKAAKKILEKPPRIHEKEVLLDNDFLGLTVLSSGIDATVDVDIVAVHGLAGHGFKTWSSRHKMWLRDFLPTQLPRSRIMTYGYNSDFRDSADVSNFRHFAQRLLVSLDEKRSEQEKERPIIFICHSLGGIIVKFALNIARVEERTQIINSVTYGIVFLATPHQGSHTADYGAIVGLAAKASNMREELVQGLRKDSSRLGEIADEFRQYHDSLQIATFYETKKTRISKGLISFLNEVVVDQKSAVLNLKHEQQSPLNRDHREMCRFKHEEEDDYRTLYKQIERMTEKAVDAVRSRFQTEAPRLNSHFMVPYAENEHFTGREKILEQLERKLLRKRNHQRVALWGLGGVGKTQVALKYVYAQRNSGCPIFWVHASNYERFRQDYLKISQLAQIPVDGEEEKVLLNVKAWLESLESGEWILVLDNADDLLQFSPASIPTIHDEWDSTEQITLSKFIPQGSKGTLIVTTRDYQVGSRLANNATIEVVAMKPNEAKDLFSQLVPDSISTQDQEGLPQLLRVLDFLPLAIAHAAAYMRENFISPSRYFELFNTTKKDQKTLLRTQFNDLRRGSEVPEAVLTTYFITFEQVRGQNPLAANLLRLIAFFDRQGIPKKLLGSSNLEGIHDDILFDRAIGKLRALSLITQAVDGETYEIHHLVHLSIQESLSEEERRQWEAKALGVISEEFPCGEYGNWGICAAYLPHTQVIIQGPDSSKVGLLLCNVGWYLWRVGRYRDAEEYLSRCLSIREREENEDSTKTLLAVGILALVLQGQGKYDKAEEMNRRALEGKERSLGPEHPDTLASINNLASVLRAQGKYDKAEEMNRWALEGNERSLGPEHPSTLTSIDNLASVLWAQGKYDKAEEMNRRALEGKERSLGPEHPDTLTSIDNLASVLRAQGKYDKAEEMNRRALEEYERSLGPEHPDTLTSISNLALVLQGQGKYDKAEEMNRRALEGYERSLGPEHPSTLTSIDNLASVLRAQGKYDKAEEMNRRALEGYERSLGPEHPDTLISMGNLTLVLRGQGKYDQAEEMNRRVLDMREKIARSGGTSISTSGERASNASGDHQLEENTGASSSLAPHLHEGRVGNNTKIASREVEQPKFRFRYRIGGKRHSPVK